MPSSCSFFERLKVNSKAAETASPTGVSGTRKMVSMVLLAVALVVLAIELRASIGQANSVKALSAKSEEGIFDGLSLADAQSMLSLFPAESVIRETEHEKVFQYKWVSLLRPLMQQPQPQLFIVSSPSDPPVALTFFTDPDDANSGFYGDPAAVSKETGAMFPEQTDPHGIPDAPASPGTPPSEAENKAESAPTAETPASPAPAEEKTQP